MKIWTSLIIWPACFPSLPHRSWKHWRPSSTAAITVLRCGTCGQLGIAPCSFSPGGYRKFADPAGDLCCYVLCGLETGSYVFGLYPDQPALHGHYVLCWNEAHPDAAENVKLIFTMLILHW